MSFRLRSDVARTGGTAASRRRSIKRQRAQPRPSACTPRAAACWVAGSGVVALLAVVLAAGSDPASGALASHDGAPKRSSARTAPGPDRTSPSKPSRLTVATATTTSVAISWRRSSDRFGVAGYFVYRNDIRVGATNARTTRYTHAGLACGTSYRVAIEAYDRAGNRSARATIVAATAPCADSQAPSAPTEVSQRDVTASSLTVSWGAASDNLGVVGYEILRNGTLGGSTASTGYVLTALQCGTMYTIGVRAFDAAGNRSPATSVLMTTSGCPDTAAPSAPPGLAVAAASQNSVTVGWDASSDDKAVQGYGVYRGTTPIGSTGSTSYTVADLPCGASYVIAVDAYDAAGNRSSRSSITASTSACPAPPPPQPAPPPPPRDTAAPTAPTGLTVTGATGSSISLRWSASTDNTAVAGYGLYRDNAAAGTVSVTSATYSGLSCGRSYQLAVDAYDAAANRSARSGIVASTAPCPDTTPPSTPSGLSQTSSTETTIGLGWAPSTDNVGVAGYGVYLGGVRIATTSSPGHTLATLACATTYTVGVDAYDAAGSRSARATLVVSTRGCLSDTSPPSVPQNQTIGGITQSSFTMSWSPASDNVGVSGYAIYRDGARIATTSSTSYTYTGLSCGTTYTVGLQALDAAGNASDVRYASGPASTAACPSSNDTSPPSAPAGLTVGTVTQSSVSVSWSPSSDNVAVAGYGYYRNGSLVGNGTGTGYTFSGLTCGSSYTLGVDAFDAAGNRSGRASLSTRRRVRARRRHLHPRHLTAAATASVRRRRRGRQRICGLIRVAALVCGWRARAGMWTRRRVVGVRPIRPPRPEI